jgi:hypothetical protein
MPQANYKGYSFNVPPSFKELSSEEQKRRLDAMIEQRETPQEAPQEDVNDAIGILRSGLGQGVALGFGDEIEAGFKTLVGLTDNYSKTLEDVRGKIKAFRKQNPKTALVSELGGALASGLLAPASTLARVGASGAKASLGKRIGEQALLGSAFGAVHGVGTGEGTEDRIRSGITGAGFGGALGGATGAVLTGAGAVGRRALDEVKGSGLFGQGVKKASDERFATRKLTENIAQDVDDIRTLKPPAEKAEDMVIADIGANTQDAGVAIQAIGSAEKTKVIKTLEDRMINQSDRVVDRFRDLTGFGNKSIGDDFVEELTDEIRTLSNPAYKNAYNPKNDISADNFKEFLGTERFKTLQKGIREAEELVGMETGTILKGSFVNLNKGLKDKTISVEDLKNTKIPTEYVHNIKIGLDELVTKNAPKLGEEATKKFVKLVKFKDKFNNIIKTNNKDYADANKMFADKSQIKEAYRVGVKDFNKLTVDGVKKLVAGYNEGQKDAFRRGVISHIKNRGDVKKERLNFLDEVMGNKKTKAIIRETFDDPKQAKLFDDFLESEKKMADTYKKALQASTTADKQQSIRKVTSDVDLQPVEDATSGGLTFIGRNLARRAGQGLNEQRAGLLAKKLFTQDPKQQRKILDDITKQQEKMRKANERSRQIGLLGATAIPRVVISEGQR